MFLHTSQATKILVSGDDPSRAAILRDKADVCSQVASEIRLKKVNIHSLMSK